MIGDYVTSFYGRLSDLPFAELIHSLEAQGETGALYVRHEKVIKRLFFESGRITYVQSSLVRENALRRLLAKQVLSIPLPDDLLVAAGSPGFSLMGWAVEQGLIANHEVRSIMEPLQRERILEIFRWRDGEYLFQFDERPPAQFRTMGVDFSTAGLVAEGLLSVSPWEELKTYAKNNGLDFPRLTVDAETVRQTLNSSAEESRILRRIDGATPLLDIVYSAPMETDAAVVFLRRLQIHGYLEFPKEIPVTNRTLMELTDREREYAELLQSEAEALLAKNPFDMFDIGRAFNADEVRRGYYALAQRYHQTELVPQLPAQHQELAQRLFERASRHFEALINWVKAKEAEKFDYFFHLAKETLDHQSRHFEAESHCLTAEHFVALGRIDEAMTHIRRSESLVDYAAEYHRLCGSLPLYDALERGTAPNPQWINSLNEAIHLNAYDAAAHADLGLCYEMMGDLEKAYASFATAYGLDKGLQNALQGMIRTRAPFPTADDEIKDASDDQHLAHVMQFVEERENANLYEILGIDRESPDADIKQQYFNLAREMHPDSLGKLKDHPIAQRAFTMINEAYEILSSREKRRMYDRGINAAEKQKEHLDQARKIRGQQAFSKAQSLITQGEFADAIDVLNEVIELSPGHGGALCHRIWATFMRDKNEPGARETAEAGLNELTRDYPDLEDPYYFGGQLALHFEDFVKARQWLSRGLEKFPGSVLIARTIRLLNQRMPVKKPEEKKEEKKGLFGGLLGRKK